MTMDFSASPDKYTVSNAVWSMFARMRCFHLNVALPRLSDSFWQKASRFFVIEQTRKLIVKYNPSKLLSIYAKFNNGNQSEKNGRAEGAFFKMQWQRTKTSQPCDRVFVLAVFELLVHLLKFILCCFGKAFPALSQSGTLQSQLTAGVRKLSIKLDKGLFYILPNASRHL